MAQGCFVEVYNEVLRDLGSQDGKEGMLDLREDPVTGRMGYWFSSLGQRSLALSEPPLSRGLLKGEPGDSESMFSLLFFSPAHACRQEFG